MEPHATVSLASAAVSPAAAVVPSSPIAPAGAVLPTLPASEADAVPPPAPVPVGELGVPSSEADGAAPVAEVTTISGAHTLNAVEAAAAPPAAPRLDAEKLVVYDLALELHAFASGLVGHPQQRVVKDQLERASLSVVLNVAEGAGRRSKRDKRRFYTYARGSATECAAIADVLRSRRLAPARSCDMLRSYSIRVVQLLTKLDASLAR